MDPSPREKDNEPVPRIQRLFDNMWLLLVIGLVVMLVVYTGWGMWEILTMPQSTLP
jgi:predicted negative regulator of RcsB-dependent stress response